MFVRVCVGGCVCQRVRACHVCLRVCARACVCVRACVIVTCICACACFMIRQAGAEQGCLVARLLGYWVTSLSALPLAASPDRHATSVFRGDTLGAPYSSVTPPLSCGVSADRRVTRVLGGDTIDLSVHLCPPLSRSVSSDRCVRRC